MKHVVIIGNGISGITAARHIRKQSDFLITVISSETTHFYSRTALMYVYMGHMKFEHTKPYEDSFWKSNKIDLVYDHVEKIDANSKSLVLRSGKSITYGTLVIATGSVSNLFEWPGQNLKGVQTLYGYPDLQQLEENTKGVKSAVIVGGGLIGIEMAEMLTSRNIHVTFLVREEQFWSGVLPLQDATLISRHIRSHHVRLMLNTELKSIESDNGGRVRSIITNSAEQINCEFVALTVGVSPNIAVLKDSAIAVNRGVLVNEFLQTNVADVYAIGDCVERMYDLPGRSRIEQVWYTGRMMGEVVAQSICGQNTKYAPGPWFNSAKFFDIEFQTYGNIGPDKKAGDCDYYWEHASGLKAIHFVWNGETGKFKGVNAFGIRLRHECFDRWLREERDIRFVLENLEEANFDPEFFTKYESEITNKLTEKFPHLRIVIKS